MVGSWLYGGYEKPVKLMRIVKGMAMGCLLLLVFYSLLDESRRYSRALLLLGCGWTLLSSVGIRGVLSLLHVPGFALRSKQRHCCVVVGGEEESRRVGQLYESLGYPYAEILSDPHPDCRKLNDVINYYKADEVIFCSKDLAIGQIIDLMTELSRLPGRRWLVEYKIVPTDSDFVIGSNSINSAEDLYTEELRTIATPLNRRNKRLFDAVSSLLMLLLSPVLIWFQRNKKSFFTHCWKVLTGQMTWVGTSGKETKTGVFGPENSLPKRASSISQELKERLHLRYLRHYKLTTDMQILLKNLRNI